MVYSVAESKSNPKEESHMADRYVVAITRAPNSNWARVCFGKLAEQTADKVTLTDARQALYYDGQTGGEFGLAAHGPRGECRITAPVARAELSAFAGLLMDCAPAAVEAWTKAPTWPK